MGNRRELELIPSADTIGIAPEATRVAIGEQTALVCLIPGRLQKRLPVHVSEK